MCTLVMLRRPDHKWPLIIAGNRDERPSRPALPPARHWPDRPQVVAGLDQMAGGSWLGVNDYGLVASVMNREGSLGPSPGKRSRGELVLEALDHAEAEAAAEALADLNPYAYRPFNLFIGDSRTAFWLRNRGARGTRAVEIFEVPVGVSMLTARELNDPTVARIRVHRPRFENTAPPDPGTGAWQSWQRLLASRLYNQETGPSAAMTIDPESGFGTVSSALVALPSYVSEIQRPVFLYAPGPPDQAVYTPVAL